MKKRATKVEANANVNDQTSATENQKIDLKTKSEKAQNGSYFTFSTPTRIA
jgi:hypothetical protein